MTLHTEILSTEHLDFLKQMFLLKSFNSVFNMFLFPIIYIIYSTLTSNKCAIPLPPGD